MLSATERRFPVRSGRSPGHEPRPVARAQWPTARGHEGLEQVARLLRLPFGRRNLLTTTKNAEPTKRLNCDRRRIFVADRHKGSRRSERAVADTERAQLLPQARYVGGRTGLHRQCKLDPRLRNRTPEFAPDRKRLLENGSELAQTRTAVREPRRSHSRRPKRRDVVSSAEASADTASWSSRASAIHPRASSTSPSDSPPSATRTFRQLRRVLRIAGDDPRENRKGMCRQPGVLALLTDCERRLRGRAGLVRSPRSRCTVASRTSVQPRGESPPSRSHRAALRARSATAWSSRPRRYRTFPRTRSAHARKTANPHPLREG